MASPSNGRDPLEMVRGLPAGSEVEIRTSDGRSYRGTFLPSHELSGPRIVRLKLPSGYNIGVRVGPGDAIAILSRNGNGSGPGAAPPARSEPPQGSDGRPWVALLTTGGTIASRVDYRTGGVRPAKDEAEILSFYPNLEREGPVRVIPVLDRLSEEIAPADWTTIADRVAKTFTEGARGVVVAHGTDTLAYTAAALSFALRDLPGPVVLVGAQRSPDRPSSDGASNLQAATHVARTADLGEVVVLMHEGLSDTSFALHRGTRVRKMHSSRRDAFRTRNGPPLGRLKDQQLTLSADARPSAPGPLRLDPRLDPEASLLWFHPGLGPARAEQYVGGLRGVILAGTGLGHVSSLHLPWIRTAVARGVFVGMTTQCLEGSVDPFVYATGRELLRAGVTYLGDMLPETAYVKLLFGLGRYASASELRGFMLTDVAGEIAYRHPLEPPR